MTEVDRDRVYRLLEHRDNSLIKLIELIVLISSGTLAVLLALNSQHSILELVAMCILFITIVCALIVLNALSKRSFNTAIVTLENPDNVKSIPMSK